MRVVVALLSAVLAAGCSVRAAEPTKPVDPLAFVASVRPLQLDGQTICTATSINQPLDLWITADHCVHVGEGTLTIDGMKTEELFSDGQTDLAILQAAGTDVKALKIAKVGPRTGDPVKMYGYPVGYDGDYFIGEVSSPVGFISGWPVAVMRFNMTACGGNSGSVVLNNRDEVISVLQFGHGRPCSTFSGGATFEALTKLVGEFFAYINRAGQ